MKMRFPLIIAATLATTVAFGQSPSPQPKSPPSPSSAVQTLKAASLFSAKCQFVAFTTKRNLVFTLPDESGGVRGFQIVDRVTAKVLHSVALADSTKFDPSNTWVSMHSYMPDGRLIVCLASRKGDATGAGGRKKILVVLLDEATGKHKWTSLNFENPTSTDWSSENAGHSGDVCVQVHAINGQIAVINNYYLAILNPSTLAVITHTKLPDAGAKFRGGSIISAGGIWQSKDQDKSYRCDFGKPAQPISGQEYDRLETSAFPWKQKGSVYRSKAVNGIVEIKPSIGGDLRLDTGMPQLSGDTSIWERDGVYLIAHFDPQSKKDEFFILEVPLK